jgi:hypothetical protein
MGRRTPATPFEQFYTRLARTCLGRVRTEPVGVQSLDAPQAWLKPVRQEDVAHARALCQEYRVALILDGGKPPTALTQATLWVSPQTEGATFSLVDTEAGIWKIDAGCSLAQLQETGVFAEMALGSERTLAHWFAWPGMSEAVRVVERAEVMLADGTVEVLGPFGASAQAPLRSLTMQRLVPKLFELAVSDAAQRCARVIPWPACYRLDALIATATHEPNLAQLFFGHQGRLGWVQTLWLRRTDPAVAPQRSAQTKVDRAIQTPLTAQLDEELKHILDPLGVFGSNSQLMGLESGS